MAEAATRKFDIRNVDLFYDDFQALKDITFTIDEKNITALIGPSGCGKSTFLRLLNRLNDLIVGVTINGSVEYDGIDIYIYYDVIELRRRVGMVFQKPNPFPMSIYDNIAHGPKVHGIRKRSQLEEIIEKSLKQAALWDEVKDRLHTPAFGLSGGQQQRLCIARVLSVEPDVVLLDEPTSALDPISTARIEDLLIKLKQDYTIVIVTHNLQQAARVADKTAFFLNGELIEYGPTTDIFINPKHQKTEAYILGQFG